MMNRKNRKRITIGLAVSLLILVCLLCMAGKEPVWDGGPQGQDVKRQEGDSESPYAKQQEKDSQSQDVKRQEEGSESQGKKQQEEGSESQGKKQQEGNPGDSNPNQKNQNQESQNRNSDGEDTGAGRKWRQESKEEILDGQIQEKLLSMTLQEKVAQLFVITPEALTGYSSVTQAGETTRSAFDEYPVGGLIFFESNIRSEEQVTEMTEKQQEYSRERIGLPLFISVDEEGGQVTRIASKSGFNVPSFPDISEIGKGQDMDQAYRLGDSIGAYLERMGFNLDYAPVADVLSNPDNTVVGRRSYGNSPQIVSQMVLENLNGLQQHRVYGCIKHFPGHGATLGDTHEGYAYTDMTWEELSGNDIIPFRDSIAWGVDFIMVGHISLPQVTGDDVPASLSPYVIGSLLRQELGYDGIVLTDALNMGAITRQYSSSQAAVKAITAGSDMIMMPSDFKAAYEGVLNAVQDGVITEGRLDESLARILRIKLLISEEDSGSGMEEAAL